MKTAQTLILPIFTICTISLYWVGLEQCFIPRKKYLLLTNPKSGLSYLYVKNWLRYAVLKLGKYFLPRISVLVTLPFTTISTFCLISLDWVGLEQRFTPRWKHLLLSIPKSGVSYMYCSALFCSKIKMTSLLFVASKISFFQKTKDLSCFQNVQ